jgi:uncharacterized membrane protein
VETSVKPGGEKSALRYKKGSLSGFDLHLMLFILAHVLIFLVLFQTCYKTPYTASALYFNYASNIMQGDIPYRDFNFEYPPFALVFFILPRLIAPNYWLFASIYEIETLVFSLVGLLVIYSTARRLGKAPWKLLAIYTLAILATGPIIAEQYDIFPAIMLLLAIYYFWTGRHKISWALLALGTMTKVFPIAVAPIFLLYYLRNRQYKLIWAGTITFAVISLIIAIPFFTIGQEAIRSLIIFHAQRGIQIESTYSAFLLAAGESGLIQVDLVFNFGSWNLSGPLADTLARLSTYLTVIFLLIIYWYIYRQMKPGKSQFTRIGIYSILVLTAILITSKVLSPQYLIWIIPLFPLVLNRWRYTILLTFLFTGGLTYFIFPVRYLAFLNLDPQLIAILLIRDILIILLAALAAASLRYMKGSE